MGTHDFPIVTPKTHPPRALPQHDAGVEDGDDYEHTPMFTHESD